MEAIDLLLTEIRPNPEQPRRHFDAEELEGLAQSIRENGVIQPVVVYKNGDGCYHLIDGERRWRAAKLAGLERAPAVVRDCPKADEKNMLAMVANMQRADLTPMEEAQGFQKMVEMGLSITKIAHRLGISYPKVHARLSLLKLESEIQELIKKGVFPTDKRAIDALLAIEDGKHRVKLASKLARQGLRVQTVVMACTKLNDALQAQPAGENVPALHYAVRHAGKVDFPKWDILQQVGKVPPWKEVEKAARITCDRCPLRETASAVICKDCPALLMLSQLIEQAGG
jgi:ParB/RepB/Spo0J family partition protein